MSRKDELERNAEYQRRKIMTRDERAIGARDGIAKNLHEQNVRDGKHTPYEQAHREATKSCERVERRRDE